MLKNAEFVDKLRFSRLRTKKQRLKICEVLFNREKTFHFTVNQLAKSISEQINQKISLATIYNTYYVCFCYSYNMHTISMLLFCILHMRVILLFQQPTCQQSTNNQ